MSVVRVAREKKHILAFGKVCIVFSVLALVACASKPKVRSGGLFGPPAESAVVGGATGLPSGPAVNELNVGSQEIYGPDLPKDVTANPEAAVVGAAEVIPASPVVEATNEAKEPKFCVVLGPGAAYGFAHVGALEALIQSGIPIHCLVGVEIGAVVAAIAAQDLNSNNIQWQTFKIKQENFFDMPLFSLGQSVAQGKKLASRLQESLGNKSFSQLKAKLGVVTMDPRTRKVVRLTDGNVADAVSASVALPGIFSPWKLRSGIQLSSGAAAEPLAVNFARMLGGTFILAIHTTEDVRMSESKNGLLNRLEQFYLDTRATAEYQKREADLVLLPDLRAFQALDFEKRAEISAQGKEAMQALLDRLKTQWQEHQERFKK